MPRAAGLGGAAAKAAAAGGGRGGGSAGAAAPQEPDGRPPSARARAPPPQLPQPPPPPDDLPVLRLLQQGDLFGGGGGIGEVPLLVPLTNGAVTNISFNESYGEPQEALIERYLTLMGLAPQKPDPQPTQPQQQPLPPPPPQQQPPQPADAPAPIAAVATRSGGTVSGSRRGAVVPDPNRSGTHSPALDGNGASGGASSGGGGGADQGGGAAAAAAAPATTTDGEGEEPDAEEFDDDLVLSHRRQARRQRRQQEAAARALLASSALASLGLDRPSLARRGVPEALIAALHRGLAANAAAFFRTCLAEQRRLVALTRGSGPAVPLADRLLAFITGTEEHLKAGSALPDLVDLRAVKDTQAVLDAVSPPRPAPAVPFHHELMHQRQQQQQHQQSSSSPSSSSPPPPSDPESAPDPAPEEPSLSELLDLDKITALASAGNVPGLRALMRSLVAAADYSRASLQQRLAAEGERAQRECERGSEARRAADKLREQLAARNALLAERGAELEAACRRATSAEEALVTERSTVAGLRGQLRQLTADYEAQHRQLRAGLEAHLTRPASAKLLAQALGQPLDGSGGPTRSGGKQGASSSSGSSDAELRALGQQLATARGELALAELTCQQERAAARQLRVMLDSARATVELHSGRAAAAAAEAERLGRLASASADLASAHTGGIASLEQQLAQEKAAHRRTTERLQATAWKFEQARTCVVDVRARAAHNLRRLQTALADVNLRAVTAERQLADATVELRHTCSELEAANNTLEALRDRSARLEGEMEVLRNDAAAARLDSREVEDALRETRMALSNAEARVAQMQQKVMEDADTVMAGRLASQKLEVLEKTHDDLQSSHRSLQLSHTDLSEVHAALQADMEQARVQVAELEVKATQLQDLTTKHNELKAAKARLDQQYAGTVKAKSLLSSELAGLKKHADVLAEQVQEYRRTAEGSKLALEEEKEAHRHTREELSMTATKRDELEFRCNELASQIDGLDVRTRSAEDEAARCRRTAELAGHQRAEAFAMRDAMMKVRMALTCDVKEYLATIDDQVRQMTGALGDLRSSFIAVQSRLLDLDPATLDGTASELPRVPYEDSQKMMDGLFRVVTHGSQLLDTQDQIRKALVERVEHLEEGIKERLATATDYWRQVLILSRSSPKSMIQMVEHMTGQAVKELDLDPVNPLAKMVPVGVLEEAGLQLNIQSERAGMLRDRADVSQAKGDAAAKLLEYERQMTASRAAEYQALVDSLSRQVNRLKARVGSLEANNVMQQRATADMQRMLTDAEWKVAKAIEREALVGIKNMVPHGRDTKAVQTVFSDLYMMTSAAVHTGLISPTPSLALPLATTGGGGGGGGGRPLLLQARSMGAAETAVYDAGELLSGDESCSAEYGRQLAAAAAAAAAGADAPGSPASLPPLSALNSPSVHGGAGGSGGAIGSWAVAATPGAVGAARNPPPASARPQSNLSRASSALPPAPPPVRCTSPDMATSGPDGGDGGGGGPRMAFTDSGGGGRGASSSGGGSGRPPTQRRRHPDEVPRRSAGSALSPVPSLNSLNSTNSVASDAVGGGGGAAAAAAGAGVAATERGYTSDGAGVRRGAATSDDEYYSPSPSTSPPVLFRTPSASATAAAAAAFAAAKSSLSGAASSLHPHHPHHHHTRPATAGPPINPWTLLPGSSHAINAQHSLQHPHHYQSHPHQHIHHHAARLTGAVLHSSRPGSPAISLTPAVAAAAAAAAPSPATPSGIPHGWQHAPWDWLPDAAALARGGATAAGAVAAGAVLPYSRQALLEMVADIHYTKGLHDQVAAAAAFPPTPMQQYVGAYFEARHGPRGGNPPTAEVALAQLLLSLEAHSALYEVMLFARVAGLQAWIGKGAGRNGSAASRPTTAQSLKASVGGGFASRPRTPRDSAASPGGGGALSPSRPGTASPSRNPGHNRTLSARSSMPPAGSGGGGSGGGGGGLGLARNSLAVPSGGGPVSARNSLAPPGGGPVLLGLVPSTRPGTAASPPLSTAGLVDGLELALQPGAGGGGGIGANGETILRLRTGLAPALITSSSAAAAAAAGGYMPYGSFSGRMATPGGGAGPLAAAPSLPSAASQQPPQLQQPQQSLMMLQQQMPLSPLPPPPPPLKPQLRVRPEVLVSEPLSSLLSRLGEVSGMEALSQFVSSGRLLGRLAAADLGQPLPEEMHPELHFVVQRVATALGLPEVPELLVRQSLPYGVDVMLLQLPNLATSALALLAQGDVDRQIVSHPAAAPSAAAGGWRRRAVLLVTPALVAAAAAVAAGLVASGLGAVAPGLGGGGSGGVPMPVLDGEELQALLGAALAPIAMPGGSGWRFELQTGPAGASAASMGGAGGGGSAGGAAPAAAATTAAAAAAPPAASASTVSVAPGAAAASSPLTLLSAAEVITAVNAAALKPRALPAVLPSQLQFKWERLLAHLRIVAATATASADRGALLATQNLAAAVRAVFRAGAGLGVQEGGAQLGNGEELLLQAQTMPFSDEQLVGMATLPLHDAAAEGGETRRGYALARVALLTRWAEAPEYRQTLRSAVM